ncbi:glycoside hydrolase family 3 N-terminal domain-containing protein [Ammonicoccus fulvus]|uniref:beta-N-acetylhexosaminidase n=1 Tax=Ammonicoccus fulvus TaxID=3138240 RepID=A0ABZ3FMG2_9ACTN
MSTTQSLDPRQKAAQLLMVGMTTSTTSPAHRVVQDGDAGSVILLGGWASPDSVSGAAEELQQLAPGDDPIGIWVAVDQEGGQVQQVKGQGIDTIPSALEQADLPQAELRAGAATWARQLADLGVHINLAPVADVVPTEIGTSNAPIGYYSRQYGATADEVTPPMLAFMQGMQDGGLVPTVKHFPGIGRISGNTDQTATGIDDHTMTPDDPMLDPFRAAIDEGAPMIMVSTARYPQIDPDNQAAFSRPIITDLLREQLGFDGVVITDDVGAARSVEATSVADRATLFIDSGGDLVLTADPEQIPQMNQAISERYGSDPAFAAKVDASVERVLTLKDAQNLLPCSG